MKLHITNMKYCLGLFKMDLLYILLLFIEALVWTINISIINCPGTGNKASTGCSYISIFLGLRRLYWEEGLGCWPLPGGRSRREGEKEGGGLEEEEKEGESRVAQTDWWTGLLLVWGLLGPLEGWSSFETPAIKQRKENDKSFRISIRIDYMYLVSKLSIIVSVSHSKHVLNIIITHFNRKVFHDKMKLWFR